MKSFSIQEIWENQHDRYCEDCEYKRTETTLVPYGDISASIVDHTCVLLENERIPASRCPAYDDWEEVEEYDE